MERQELLTQFNTLVETYGQHKAYGEKAREQADKFSSGIIEKVIADHQIKAALVADDILPLVPLLSAEIGKIEAAKSVAEQSKGDLGARVEELELRKLIGELSDEDFEGLAGEGRDTVAAADAEIESLNEGLSALQGALDKWVEISGASVDVDVAVSAGEAPAVDVQEVAVDFDDDDAPDSVVDAILPGFESESDGDVSEPSMDEESVSFDIGDEDDEGSVDVVPVSVASASVEVEVEVEVEAEAESSGVDEIGVDPSEDAAASDVDDAEGPRRAILLSNEGTPDEQIYALTGDVFTIGRGRDNDLQIKNDSKVSRFHCKLYRRASNYYLEDNKSSNGTMVNGELISERRLFGGEELVIGETFFRFRVM
jgi:hypothetical protein